MARYDKWCPELEAELAEPFAVEVHQNKGSKGTFVSIRFYVERLNDLVGVAGWSMPSPLSYHSGNKLGLGIGITVLGVTKWNVGDEMEDHGEPIEYTDERTGEVKEKVVDYGSSSTNSFAQGFKRCCAYGFGLGLYLYDKQKTRALLSGRATTQQRSALASPHRAPRQPPSKPAAKRNGKPELALPTQRSLITELLVLRVVNDDQRATVESRMEDAELTRDEATKIAGSLRSLPLTEAPRG